VLSPVNDDRLKAALTYAARGWYTFPAPPDGSKKSLKAALYSKTAEHPDGAPWGKTRAEAEIRADWQRWPDANIGLPTGAASGFIVIEADTMEGHQVDGLASLRKLEAEHGKLPDTRTTVSPSGSPHLYFKHPGVGIKIRSAPLDQVNFPGIDVKGDGGMVLAPPSVRPGKGEYKVVNDLPLADLPQWLLDLLLAASHRPASAARAPGDKPSPTAQQVLAAVAVTPNDGVKADGKPGTTTAWRSSPRPTAATTAKTSSTPGRRSLKTSTTAPIRRPSGKPSTPARRR
jgi:hypothetical protein